MSSRIKAKGFITTLTNMGEQVWQAKVSGKNVVYDSELGTVRICPTSYEQGLKTAEGKPTTLNHTDTINGIIKTGEVDKDGDPVLKWQVDEATQAMMVQEGWNGGVSLAFFPTKLREDPEGIADYIAVEWEIDALGIGDGSEKPACPTGLCNPQQVTGMASENEAKGGGVATAEEIKAKQEALAIKQKAEAEAAAAKAAKEAAEAEKQLKQLKSESTEDTMKVFESLLDSKLTPLQKENEELKAKLEEVTTSDDAGKKFKEEIVAQKKAALIAELPADVEIDYESKTLDELTMLKQIADKVKGETAPPPAAPPVDVPEADGGSAAVTKEGWTEKDIQEYNQKVKDRYRVKQPKQ